MALAPSRRGIALFMVSAVLALLALLSAALLGGTRLASSASAAGAARTGARNAAGSGLAYAAARLVEQGGGYPLFPRTTENNGDDWAYREASTVPLARAERPSWTHGPFRSGRLRGTDDAFALRVDPAGGGLPVNAGPPSDPGLAHALDNLGAILLAATPDRTLRIGREDVPAGSPVPGEPILVSRLGEHLLSGRPAGGYPSVAAVREALRARAYTADECDLILPHLDIGPYDTIGGSGLEDGTGRLFPHQPVALSSATLPVLKSLWMYLRPSNARTHPHPTFTATPPGYGEPGLRAGGNIPFGPLFLYPDEAENLAGFAERFRARPDPASWLAFRQELVTQAPSLFDRDHGRLASLGLPAEGALWARMKADVAFFAVTRDRPSDGVVSNHADWTLWHGGPGNAHPVFPPDVGAFAGFPRPAAAPPRWPDGDANAPYDQPAGTFQPPGLTLAPPVRFSVTALGRNGSARETASGTFRAAERIEFTGQEDFENRASTAHLAGQGIAVEAPASRVPLADPDDPAMPYPRVVTVPDAHFPGWTPPGAAYPAFDRYRGAIGLAARAFRQEDPASPGNRPWAAVSPIDHYWPFTEDDLLTGPEEEFASITPGSVRLVAAPPDSGASPWWCGTGTPIDPSLLPPGYPILGLGGDTCLELWLAEHRSVSGGFPGFLLRTLEVSQGHGGGPSGNDDSGGGGGPVEGFMQLWAEPRESETAFRLLFRDWPVLDLATNAPSTFSGDVFGPAAARVPRVHPAGHIPSSGRVRSGQEHVILVVDDSITPPAPGTTFTLYIDGIAAATRFVPSIRFRGDGAGLAFSRIDEVRWFHWVPDAAEVAARYAKGRFILPGTPGTGDATYRSPRYRFDAPARIRSGSWTGVPCHDPRIGITVRARALDTAGGMVRDMPLGTSGTVTRFAAGTPFDGFDYDVSFANGSADLSPLYHTPLFESAWFTVQRKGRAPAWDHDR